MRPVLAWPNWSDQAAITGSTAQSGAPLANLQRKQPKQLWASANVSSAVYMELNRGSQQTWNIASVLYANATRNATWRVRAATNQGALTSLPSYDFGGALVFNGSTQYGYQIFSPTGTLSNATLIVRCMPSTIREQGIARFGNGTDEVSIEMGASSFYFYKATPTSGTPLISIATGVANTWVHVCVVISGGSTAKIYVDGVLMGTETNWAAHTYDRINLAHVVTNRLHGRVDDVQFHTRAFTADEVVADFVHAGTRATPADNFHSYFNLDGNGTNTGSEGGALTLVASPAYAPGARFTASPYDYLTSDRRHSLLWVPDTVFDQWVRVDIDDPTNADLVFEAGRLVVGNGWQHIQTYPGNLPSFDDSTQVETLPGGQSAINAGTPVPVATMNIRAGSESELMTYLYDIAARRGSSKDVLLVRDPDPANAFREHGMCYGLLQNGIQLNLPDYGRFESRIDVRGML